MHVSECDSARPMESPSCQLVSSELMLLASVFDLMVLLVLVQVWSVRCFHVAAAT